MPNIEAFLTRQTLYRDLPMVAGSYWNEKPVVVTGGASFIGSHLVDKLYSLGASVTVIDNLSSGTLENLSSSPMVNFVNLDLESSRIGEMVRVFKGNEVVFHLAATHGGRGYIDSHPADVSSNFAIDHRTFEAAYLAGIEKVVFASSACVYPPSLQEKYDSDYLLKEEDSNTLDLTEPLSADLEYGWAKLMGEIQLCAFIRQYGLKGCCARFVSVYGERENETHSIMALIHKANERMDPFVIWGNGEQSRDFTYVSDIVDGTILAAEKVDDGMPINLGTGKRFKLREVALAILNQMKFYPKQIDFDLSKPTGVVNRALDISRAKEILGWEPKVSLEEGLSRTISWYVKTHFPLGKVNSMLLMERRSSNA
jgi:nucleoside-diphosphate-sugar epimerase